MNIIKPFSLKRLGALAIVSFMFSLVFFLMVSVGIDMYYWIPTVSLQSWAAAFALVAGMGGGSLLFAKSLTYLINYREKNAAHD